MQENRTIYKVSEVICIKCCNRWISVRPKETLLKQIYCPNCNKEGYIIETGEDLDNEYNNQIGYDLSDN